LGEKVSKASKRYEKKIYKREMGENLYTELTSMFGDVDGDNVLRCMFADAGWLKIRVAQNAINL
jgi:hypothetical protein